MNLTGSVTPRRPSLEASSLHAGEPRYFTLAACNCEGGFMEWRDLVGGKSLVERRREVSMSRRVAKLRWSAMFTAWNSGSGSLDVLRSGGMRPGLVMLLLRYERP